MKFNGHTNYAVLLVTAAILSSTTAWASDDVPIFTQDDPARIWMENSKLYFYGAISTASLDAFQKFVDASDTSEVRTFVINSLGGDTASGRVIGRWINENGLDVEVDAICFSSCANYIFPAGASKTIRAASFVGWHGSETQYDVIAQSMPDKTGRDLERAALLKALIPALPEHASSAVIEQAIDQQIIFANKSRKDEAAFFAQIGVSGEFTLHAMRPENIDKWRASGRAGWTYSLDDMQRLGLGTVQFLGSEEYSKSSQVRKNVVVIGYDPSIVPD